MKRAVSVMFATVMLVALATPASAFDSAYANGAEPTVAGNNSTLCAIRESGAVYCWGSNVSGQLGRGTGEASSLTVAPVFEYYLTPALSISANAGTICKVTTARHVYCWGNNAARHVGSGSVAAYLDYPRRVTGLTNVRAVSVGPEYACAVRQDGTVWCWGKPACEAFAGFPSGTAQVTRPSLPRVSLRSRA